MKNENFSIVLGGPLYQFYLRSRLARPQLELLPRRIAAFVVMTWLPLLLLSLLGARCWGAGVSFFHDVELHVRFLVALPLLIAAESIVHERIKFTVDQFTGRGIVLPKDLGRFEQIMQSIFKLRNSMAVEVGLLVLVYTVGRWLWWGRFALHQPTWYATVDAGAWQLTPAGRWYAWVSLPLFQFVLLRWYFRFFLWACFLWRVSKLDLRLIPAHPDRAGGLSFLGVGSYAFAPILLAEGTMLAGLITNQIIFNGQNLLSFKIDIIGSVLAIVVVVLAPLAVFMPLLAKAKRIGGAAYGALAYRYAQEFEDKWVEGKAPSGEQLIGTADIQSLADMGNSYMFVKQMRPIPFGPEVVLHLVFMTLVPILPLLLTVMPLEQLAGRLIQILL